MFPLIIMLEIFSHTELSSINLVQAAVGGAEGLLFLTVWKQYKSLRSFSACFKTLKFLLCVQFLHVVSMQMIRKPPVEAAQTPETSELKQLNHWIQIQPKGRKDLQDGEAGRQEGGKPDETVQTGKQIHQGVCLKTGRNLNKTPKKLWRT